MPSDYKIFDWPLNGRLITAVDPILLGEGDFQELTNFRYTDGGIRGVGGMTKINTSPTTNLTIQNGFHFVKDSPTESHVIIQTTTGANSTLVKSANGTIPNQDTFAAFLTLTGNNTVYFSNAPDSCMACANGNNAYIWGGTEYRTAKFINFAPDGSFWYDYTSKITNTINDANNVATLYRVAGLLDANVMALYHADNNAVDASGKGHNLTVANVTYDASNKVFGTHAFVFNGSNAQGNTADHADFNFAGGTFTIDARIRPDSLAANRSIYYQETDLYTLALTSGGTYEVVVGDVITGNISGTTATVHSVDLQSGTWAGGTATCDFWIHSQNGAFVAENLDVGANGNVGTVAGNSTNANNCYFHWYVSTTGALTLEIFDAPANSTIVSVATAASTISANNWYHVELVENGNNWYQFVGPNAGNATLKSLVTDANRAENYISKVFIGHDNGSQYFSGQMDEIRVSNSARHTSDFAVPLVAYGNTTETYAYVGSTRPLSGIKLYIGTANTGASSTVTVYEWNGTAWAAVSGLSDGTSANNITLAQTGTISFNSTVATSLSKIIRETHAYYYQLVFSGADNSTSVYYSTVNAPIQSPVDIWDGVERITSRCLKYTTAYADYSAFVTQEDYDASDVVTYADFSSLTSSQFVYLGFTEKMQAVHLVLPDASYVNTTANTVLTVQYWNGRAWTTVGSIEDGTSASGISFNQGGTISWQAVSEGNEYKTTIGNKEEYFYYRLSFSQNLSAQVRVDYIYGIPSPVPVFGYKFPVLWQNRLWLCGNVNGRKNTARCTSAGTVSIFNGSGSTELEFGDGGELVAGETIFSRFSSSLYDNMVLFKKNAIYLVDGTSPEDFKVYTISDQLGCVAPLTLKKCDTSFEVTQGLSKHVLIWMGQGGFYAFDGNSIVKISGDIDDMFDPLESTYIGTSVSGMAAFYDPHRQEYHWLTGTLEMVYDLIKKKWFKIERGTADLKSGWRVADTSGTVYQYGGTGTGYVERLENGNDFDGEAIAYAFRLGSMPLGKSAMIETTLRKLKLTGVSKTTTANNVTVQHYADTSTTATTIGNLSQNSSNRCYVSSPFSCNINAIYHDLRFTISTNNETIGFEPILVSGMYRPIREDVI